MVRSLPIDDIVRVTISLSGTPAPRSGFNAACIIGASAVIPDDERIRIYSSIDSMLDDGFTADSEEYKAALLYFSQSPRPLRVIIGRKGADESFLDAVAACVQASADWYMVYCCGAESADIQAISAYIETKASRVLAYDTDDDAVLSAEGGIFAALKALGYERSIGLYSTTPYAACAMMGFAMGANDGTYASAYTLAYKPLIGVATDDLTETQLSAVRAANGNAYVLVGSYYTVLRQGVMANGEPFDTRLGIDQLVNNMQLASMDMLAKTKTKIPQTETGMAQIKAAIAAECDKAVHTRFLAPGIWNQDGVLNLARGDLLSAGYMIQSDDVNSQTAAERASRVSPAIYVALKLAGAIEGIVIKVNVDR